MLQVLRFQGLECQVLRFKSVGLRVSGSEALGLGFQVLRVQVSRVQCLGLRSFRFRV